MGYAVPGAGLSGLVGFLHERLGGACSAGGVRSEPGRFSAGDTSSPRIRRPADCREHPGRGSDYSSPWIDYRPRGEGVRWTMRLCVWLTALLFCLLFPRISRGSVLRTHGV